MEKIFIIHGWTYTTDRWQNFIARVKEGGYESVLLTVPGLTEATDKVWSLDDYVEWLKQKLENEDQSILVGHSNGGRIALAFAAKYPGKLKQLILIDSAGIYHNELPLRFKRMVFGALAKIGKKITASENLRKVLYKFAGESDYKNASPQMRQTMVNLISVDLTPKLPAINTPTLIIWGREDKATPLADGELMHKLIATSQLNIINGARHSPHFTHTKEVCDAIIQTIKKYGF